MNLNLHRQLYFDTGPWDAIPAFCSYHEPAKLSLQVWRKLLTPPYSERTLRKVDVGSHGNQFFFPGDAISAFYVPKDEEIVVSIGGLEWARNTDRPPISLEAILSQCRTIPECTDKDEEIVSEGVTYCRWSPFLPALCTYRWSGGTAGRNRARYMPIDILWKCHPHPIYVEEWNFKDEKRKILEANPDTWSYIRSPQPNMFQNHDFVPVLTTLWNCDDQFWLKCKPVGGSRDTIIYSRRG